MAENKGVLVPKSDVELLQARQRTSSSLPGQIGTADARFSSPAPFTGSIRRVLYFFGLSIARLIGAGSRRSCEGRLERRGNGRGRGHGKGRCLRS